MKTISFLSVGLAALAVLASLPAGRAFAGPPEDVAFTGPANSPISAAVSVPANRSLFLTSGTVPPVADESAPAGSPARYGDTRTQGTGALKQIEARLKEVGLTLKDVVYLRVYVAADKTKDGKFDYTRAGSMPTASFSERRNVPSSPRVPPSASLVWSTRIGSSRSKRSRCTPRTRHSPDVADVRRRSPCPAGRHHHGQHVRLADDAPGRPDFASRRGRLRGEGRERPPDARNCFSNTPSQCARARPALPHRGRGWRGAPARDGRRHQSAARARRARALAGAGRTRLVAVDCPDAGGSPGGDVSHRGGRERRTPRGLRWRSLRVEPSRRRAVSFSVRGSTGPPRCSVGNASASRNGPSTASRAGILTPVAEGCREGPRHGKIVRGQLVGLRQEVQRFARSRRRAGRGHFGSAHVELRQRALQQRRTGFPPG